jgi:hypothetical protein
MAERKPDLSPPWVIFSAGGKPVAILPAGRPGEVANVEGLPGKLVKRIVNAANQEGGGSYMKRMEAITARLEAIQAKASRGRNEQKDTLAELVAAARRDWPANITQLVTLGERDGRTVVAIQLGVDDAEKLLAVVEAAKKTEPLLELWIGNRFPDAAADVRALRAALTALEGEKEAT